MSSGLLHSYFLRNSGKRLHKWFHYFDIYERHFLRFRDRQPTVLEIGVSGGGSLEMWRDFFGEGARIVGVDLDPKCAAHSGERIDVHIGDQTDPALLNQLAERYGPFDIVIDDGSHRMNHTRATFDLLYPHVHPTGIYLVEDMHVAYSERFGGGLGHPDSFIEFVKARIDDLNAFNCKTLAPTPFTSSTDAICIYDGIIVFERRPRAHRQHAISGAPQHMKEFKRQAVIADDA